jgi:hypothetical protein
VPRRKNSAPYEVMLPNQERLMVSKEKRISPKDIHEVGSTSASSKVTGAASSLSRKGKTVAEIPMPDFEEAPVYDRPYASLRI